MCILQIPPQKCDTVTSVQFGELWKPIHSERDSQRQSSKYKVYSVTFINLFYSAQYSLQKKNPDMPVYNIKKTEYNIADPTIREEIFLFIFGITILIFDLGLCWKRSSNILKMHNFINCNLEISRKTHVA